MLWARTHLIIENMASSAASASTERNLLGKRLNSQTKYLLMKLWEYFKQEAKNCKFSVNIKERISKVTGNTFFAGFWHTLRHTEISKTSIVRVRMEYRKKGSFSMPRKGYKKYFAQACSIVIVRYKRSLVCVDADSFDHDAIRQKIHSLYGGRKIYRSQRF